MIKKAGQMEKEVREQMRGGKGQVEIIHIFKKEELKAKTRLCALMVLEPGSSIGTHEHVEEEEIYYILKGKGVVEESGVKREVTAGDAVLTGGGASHSVENTGDEPLEIMAVILLYI